MTKNLRLVENENQGEKLLLAPASVEDRVFLADLMADPVAEMEGIMKIVVLTDLWRLYPPLIAHQVNEVDEVQRFREQTANNFE